MRLKVASMIIFSALVLCVIGFNGFINASTNPPGYGFNVSITPEQNSQGIFTAKFTVTNLNSSAVVAAPTIRFRAGEPAESTSVSTEGGTSFSFSVSVDDKASIAEYEVKVLEGASIISRSQASISLHK
jgi:hypothetical protein